ncbi:MAG TPA: enoyl-CoA hydratase-related protein [Ignavibacteria bacterium]|nr:2-(1,2-epoxy-1,2-dihydrophenyl)acetyl-CoA isomerase [Bacteroidota bacterium]HRI84995.1 enoyl-CoA hydratase-related protein [Ignavibacteria bacterium]HRJ98051.1 enoyl-CoA hydratase-related protein [Ignavibacteria bacterium]
MYNTILIEKKESVLYITLNRPEVFNAFNEEMLNELNDAFEKAADDKDIRCIVLTGAGKAFCSGQDLKDFNEKKSTFKEVLDNKYNPLIKKITEINVPVICSVNGVAAGAGMSLALACDYRIGAENSSMTEVFINVGLVPDSGSGFFLPRITGYAKAFELCVTGEKITAAEALKLGLMNKVVSNIALLKKYTEITAKQFASRPTFAIGLIKQLLRKSFESDLQSILETESEFQQRAGDTYDFKEGINSFLEKRKADFKGN